MDSPSGDHQHILSNLVAVSWRYLYWWIMKACEMVDRPCKSCVSENFFFEILIWPSLSCGIFRNKVCSIQRCDNVTWKSDTGSCSCRVGSNYEHISDLHRVHPGQGCYSRTHQIFMMSVAQVVQQLSSVLRLPEETMCGTLILLGSAINTRAPLPGLK